MKFAIVCLSITLFLQAPLLHADTKIYHWVDENGNSHFSDTAVPGTEQITADNKNLVSAEALKADSTAKKNSGSVVKAEKGIEYQAEIISPQNDMAIRSNEGTLEIHVKITPEKTNTQRLQLILDGEALGSPQISPTIRALNVDRGTHQIQVQLLGAKDKILATTQIVTVHLQRVSIK
ncbi:DUF4124 domain-containing protein [Psychromonas sp. RZ22]|uniref:DUF4124 domain-containing protein n=1 Tax=Psychromonas algarum TaxID=2555643 RepID=UPI0010685F43|nr:DUF4124 domain-containing protein [Psychromonas sp. RZ22]TEW54208.1 DUF4124 domain-containing protein [Psychromonas sp. RZ22]